MAKKTLQNRGQPIAELQGTPPRLDYPTVGGVLQAPHRLIGCGKAFQLITRLLSDTVE
jgi:hypothetical protein